MGANLSYESEILKLGLNFEHTSKHNWDGWLKRQMRKMHKFWSINQHQKYFFHFRELINQCCVVNHQSSRYFWITWRNWIFVVCDFLTFVVYYLYAACPVFPFSFVSSLFVNYLFWVFSVATFKLLPFQMFKHGLSPSVNVV